MRVLPHSVRGRGSSTSTSSAALRAEFYYRLRGFKKGMKLHPQEGQKPCVQQSMGIVENGACLPAVAVADAFASSLARGMDEQEVRLADLKESFTKFKEQQDSALVNVSKFTEQLAGDFKAFGPTLSKGLREVLLKTVVTPHNALAAEHEELKAKVKILEGLSQLNTPAAAAGVSPRSVRSGTPPTTPQQPVHDMPPCAPQPTVRNEDPFPMGLIFDKRDEAYLAGLSTDAREAVLEQRQAANWQWVRQKDGAPSLPSCLPIRPTPQRARKVSFADLPLERVDTVPQSAPLAPFDECRSLEAAWLELYGGIVSKKAARHLLDVRGMKERPNADYAMLAMAARGTRC